MKKYLIRLPLILYPYAYLIWLAFYFASAIIAGEHVDSEVILDVYGMIFIIFQIIVLADVIYGAIEMARNGITAKQAARLNLVVKCVHIPAYIFHFFMGLLGICMSVWGIGFILVAFVVDAVTILLSGMHAIGSVVKLYREGVLPTKASAVKYGIGSFIYVLDVVIAFVLVYKERKFNSGMKL